MSRRFDIVVNKTEVPTAVYRVLLDFALKVVLRDVPGHLRESNYQVTINPCGHNIFMGRFTGGNTFRLGFKEPSKCKSFVSRLADTPFSTFNEMVVGIAAWMFAQDMLGDSRKTRAISHDAIVEAQQQADLLAAEVAQAQAHEESKEGQKFYRTVLVNMERNSLEFKLNHIARLEKSWIRKSKLAATKLKSLRRRRSALIAANKRREAVA